MKGGSMKARRFPEPEPPRLDMIATAIAETAPALVNELLVAAPGRVYRDALTLMERPVLVHVLATTGGNQLRAARLLGLNRNTLRKRCRALQLELPGRTRRVRVVAPAAAS